jgi:hypothetical protein
MLRRLYLAVGARQSWGWTPAPLLRPLLRRDVPLAIIGGVAVSYYTGGRTHPGDIDVVVTPAAAEQAYLALCEVVDRGVISGPQEFGPDAIREGVEMTFRTHHGTLHVLGGRVAADRDGIVDRRRWVWIDLMRMPVCGLADLVALKERGEREKDLRDLELLRDLGLVHE